MFDAKGSRGCGCIGVNLPLGLGNTNHEPGSQNRIRVCSYRTCGQHHDPRRSISSADQNYGVYMVVLWSASCRAVVRYTSLGSEFLQIERSILSCMLTGWEHMAAGLLMAKDDASRTNCLAKGRRMRVVSVCNQDPLRTCIGHPLLHRCKRSTPLMACAALQPAFATDSRDGPSMHQCSAVVLFQERQATPAGSEQLSFFHVSSFLMPLIIALRSLMSASALPL